MKDKVEIVDAKLITLHLLADFNGEYLNIDLEVFGG